MLVKFIPLVLSFSSLVSLSAFGQQVVHTKSFPIDQNSIKVVTLSPRVEADQIEITANQHPNAQFRIDDMTVLTDEGLSLTFADLLTLVPANEVEKFQARMIDRAGTRGVPGKVTFNLMSPLTIISIQVRVVNTKVKDRNTKAALIVNLINSTLPPIADAPPSTPIAPNQPNTVGGTPSPNGGFQPWNPGVSTDGGDLGQMTPGDAGQCTSEFLNQEVRACTAGVQAVRTELAKDKRTLQQTNANINQLAYIRSENQTCQTEKASLTQRAEAIRSPLNLQKAKVADLQKQRDHFQTAITARGLPAEKWSCWIQGTTQRYERTSYGTPGVILGQLAKDFCGAINCPARNWKKDWGCNKLQ